ncbi:hypothetical protein [Massilia timonae]|uniref:hypothetical protein n=1 Tax=Massilia timonae TaxID=47229 RepID=UPI0028D1FC8E|nr:hypothetical protein [Massilia timonae]
MEVITPILIAVVLTSILCLSGHVVILRRKMLQSKLDQQRINELELQVHAVERRFGQELNEIESAHHAVLSEERKKLAELHLAHAQDLMRERETVTAAVKEQARRDVEEQASLFSVAVRPYVRVVNDDGYFSSNYESQAGYQYQLLINGIPAFQPHIIVESVECTKTFNDENLKELLQLATNAAETAINMYAMKAGGSVSIAQAIVERVSKK